MRKGIPTRLPSEMYAYLKHKANKRKSSLRFEANEMFTDYFRLKRMEKKLDGKKIFTIGK